MGIFGDREVGNNYGTRGGSWLKGDSNGINYTVMVKRTLGKKGQQNKNQRFFIAELRVLKSGHENIRAGSTKSFVVEFGIHRYPELALGNIEDFMRAALASVCDEHGVDRPADIADVALDKETMEAIAASEDSDTETPNPILGAILEVECTDKPTKGKGQMFTHYNWDVPSKATIQKFRKELADSAGDDENEEDAA